MDGRLKPRIIKGPYIIRGEGGRRAERDCRVIYGAAYIKNQWIKVEKMSANNVFIKYFSRVVGVYAPVVNRRNLFIISY